jgi:hypothetical protein
MPKRSREEKLAAYSQGAKRGYRARKRMQATREVFAQVEMKEPSTGGLKALDCQPGEADGLRALGNAGSRDAAQLKEQHSHGLYINENGSQAVHR